MMKQGINYYTLLGVGPEASRKEIKAVYHRLARQYHPDLNPDNLAAEELFKQINAAYEVLSDPRQRARYDQRESLNQANDRRRARQQDATARRPWDTQPAAAASGSRFNVEELNQFVISRLQRQIDRDTIIGALCQKTGLDWRQGVAFVRYAEIIHRCEIARRKRTVTRLAGYAGTSLAGALFNFLMGIFFLELSPAPGGCAGIVMLGGSVLFAGGLVGFIGTLKTL